MGHSRPYSTQAEEVDGSSLSELQKALRPGAFPAVHKTEVAARESMHASMLACMHGHPEAAETRQCCGWPCELCLSPRCRRMVAALGAL